MVNGTPGGNKVDDVVERCLSGDVGELGQGTELKSSLKKPKLFEYHSEMMTYLLNLCYPCQQVMLSIFPL